MPELESLIHLGGETQNTIAGEHTGEHNHRILNREVKIIRPVDEVAPIILKSIVDNRSIGDPCEERKPSLGTPTDTTTSQPPFAGFAKSQPGNS